MAEGRTRTATGASAVTYPRGPDDLSDADLQAIVDEINDTPMKVLDRETSNEVWHRKLGKVPSKTSCPKTNVALIN